MNNTTYTVVCPCCRVKQTGIVRIVETKVTIIPDSSDKPRIWNDEEVKELQNFAIDPGTEYIRCSYLPCQFIMFGEKLEEVTRTSVRFPADMHK